MRNIILFVIAILLVGCSKDENGIDDEVSSSKNQYYVKYVARYCSFHEHHINYRDEMGSLIHVSIPTTTEYYSVEVGPVSSIFQAYIDGDCCVYAGREISIYVKKNNQDYIQMATTLVKSNIHGSGKKSLTFNLRDYD